jgi:peptide chain release factor 1
MQPLQINHLIKMKKRCEELNKLLSYPRTLQDRELLSKYSREKKELEEIVQGWEEYKKTQNEIKKMEEILLDRKEDEEIKRLAEEEKEKLEERIKSLERKISECLRPKDKQRNVIIEIRAGAGGEEAALFAADLYKTYVRFGERKNWRIENIDLHPTDKGGFKEVIFAVEGKDAFSSLRYESGVHRVQRVPITESSGRIHTSTVTVAVLPEPEEVEIEINPEDLDIDTFHSRGAGGQHVNVTDSAVRITHLPTQIVVQCQDERSQHQNKAKAMRILRAKLLQRKEIEQRREISEQRKTQIGRGERAERIRTYNFPQNRVTDHRIHLTLHNLENILNGEMEGLVKSLQRNLGGKEL